MMHLFTYLWVRINYIDVFFLMQVLTPYFERPLVLVSKNSPKSDTDIDCPYLARNLKKVSRFSHIR